MAMACSVSRVWRECGKTADLMLVAGKGLPRQHGSAHKLQNENLPICQSHTDVLPADVQSSDPALLACRDRATKQK